MKAEQAWQAALGQLQMEMPKAAYDTWVKNTDLVAYEDGVFIIGVGNSYARDWLESRLSSTVIRMLTGIMNRTVAVRFVVWQDPDDTFESQEQLDQTENFSNSRMLTTIRMSCLAARAQP
jgi:chromosomal replication initiator protein